MLRSTRGQKKQKRSLKIFKIKMKKERIVQKNNLSYIGLILIAITFPLPFSISNIFIVLAVLLWLIEGDFINKFIRIKKQKTLWFIIGFYILHVFSLVYTENVSDGLFILEKKSVLLILPLIIASIALSESQIKNILYAFVLGNLLISIVLLSRVLFYFFIVKDCSTCFYHEFTSAVDLHAIYFSLFLLFSIYIIIFNLRTLNKVFASTAIAILSTSLIFAASKTLLITFLVLLPLFLLLQYRKALATFNKKIWLGITISLCACFISVIFLKPVKERFIDSFDTSSLKYLEIVGTNEQLTNDQKRELNGFTLRLLLAKLSLNKVFEDNAYFFGYGPADVSDQLNEVYLKHNMAPNWFFNYNTHNQYIEVFLELGIPGIIYLLSLLTIGFYYAYIHRNYLLAFFILLISVSFLTEVVLNRNKGIVFFTFFYSLFVFSNTILFGKKEESIYENSNTRNERNSK